MTNILKPLTLVSILCAYLSVLGCASQAKRSGNSAAEIQSDMEASSTANTLIRLQEPRVFPLDDKKRPFGAISDRDQRAASTDKSFRLEETKPSK